MHPLLSRQPYLPGGWRLFENQEDLDPNPTLWLWTRNHLEETKHQLWDSGLAGGEFQIRVTTVRTRVEIWDAHRGFRFHPPSLVWKLRAGPVEIIWPGGSSGVL